MDVSFVVPDARLLHSTAVVNVTAGVLGGPGGAINDSRLVFVLIPAAASAITLTIVGFRGEDGAARNTVLSGIGTAGAADTVYNLPGLKNSGAPMTLTASVADKILVGVIPG